MTARDRLAEGLRNMRRQLRPRSRPEGTDWHRAGVGGRWEELGALQFGFLRDQGLKPHHHLLDVGCGSLRGGVHFIRYLEPGHYVGIEKEPDLLAAGRDIELTREGLTDRAPRLHATGAFDLDWLPASVSFEFALAQSVLTHLRPELIQLCIRRVLPRLTPDGVFFASFFESGDARTVLGPAHGWRDDELLHPRYPLSRLRELAADAGAELEYLGAWGHPRDSKMVALRPR